MEGYDEVSIYIWHEQVNEYAMGNKTKDQAIMGLRKQLVNIGVLR